VEQNGKDSFEDVLSQAVLSIKALMLLSHGVQDAEDRMRRKITLSSDDDLRAFGRTVSVENVRKPGKLVAMGLGELIVSAFLIVAGAILALPPFVTGGSGGIQTFLSSVGSTVSYSGSGPLSSLIDFILSIILLLAAFYSLREAGQAFSEAGIKTRLR
jgi:hypothetical protein